MIQNSTYNLQIDKNQLIDIINQLEANDKIDLLNKLKNETFLKRFEKLLEELRTNELSLDEITKEVEIVRQKRYEEGRHNA
jgi:Mg/Co/Ni transporter MgtE